MGARQFYICLITISFIHATWRGQEKKQRSRKAQTLSWPPPSNLHNKWGEKRKESRKEERNRWGREGKKEREKNANWLQLGMSVMRWKGELTEQGRRKDGRWVQRLDGWMDGLKNRWMQSYLIPENELKNHSILFKLLMRGDTNVDSSLNFCKIYSCSLSLFWCYWCSSQ